MPTQCLVSHLRLPAKIESNRDAWLITGIWCRVVQYACLADKGQQARLVLDLDDVAIIELVASTGTRCRHRQMPVHEKVVCVLVQVTVAP